MNILVTGGLGFIGTHLCQRLDADGHHPIISSHRREPGNNEREHFQIVILDLSDGNQFSVLDGYEIDAIVHCAAIRGEGAQPYSEYERVNVEGTKNLVEYARRRRIKKFIHISTVGVLGTIPNPQPAGIENKPLPDSNYHLSKWKAEKVINDYSDDAPKRIILRPTITYGSSDDGFMLKFAEMVYHKKLIFPASNPHIHLLSVNQLTELIIRIIAQDLFDNGTYIIADESSISVMELADIFSVTMHGKPYPKSRQLPGIVFKFAEWFLRVISHKKLLTSLRLISRDWVYDVSETKKSLDYCPADTRETLKNEMDYYIHKVIE